MRKFILFIILLLNFLFIKVDVYANEDLKDLKVNQKDVTCAGYECNIEINTESAEITYTIGEKVKSVTPDSGHRVTFDNEHSVQFEVTYQDDTTANYTLTIKKHVQSADNTLSKLVINEEEVELKEEVFVYSYDAKYNDEIVTVIGETTDENAKCEETEYKFDLEKSSLSIEYLVTAENGNVKKYTIILKRKNKPDTTLKTLTLSDIELDYDKNKLDYEVTIPYSVDTTEIKAVANDKEAKVEVSMEDFFVVGENFIEIKVTNKEASDTYVVKINRLEKVDETLANLESLEIDGYELDFDANIYEYNLNFKEIPKNLIIDYKTVSSDADVKIEDNENLSDGSVVSIKVSLENGLVKTYHLTLNLEEQIVETVNKTLIIVLIIIMIILLILQIREKKNKFSQKKVANKAREEDIEVI